MKRLPFLLMITLLGVFTWQASAADAEGALRVAGLEDLAGAALTNALLAGEKPFLVQLRAPRPQLLPDHEFLKGLFEAIMAELDPGILAETLHIYEKPSPAQKTAWSADEEAALYNNLLALSTLEGLQYFSASRGIMRTFYETSSVIDGPSSRIPIPDPVFRRPPEKLTIYARQRDLTFGDNVYQYDYYSVPGGLIFVQQNLTSLNIGIIPAVGRNNLRSVVAVLDAGNYILVYAASMAKIAALPGMRERVGNSFANRTEAVLNWFKEQADNVFKKKLQGQAEL
jgi:hypothetical protein